MAKFGLIETIQSISQLTRELSTRLRALTFEDNFDAFETEVTEITSGASVRVRNQLTQTPSKYIIVSATGEANIGKSDTSGEEWTKDYIYFKNYGSNTATDVKIIILR